MFTPQINFTNTPGAGPVLFTDPSVVMTNSLTMQCATYVGSGSPQVDTNSPYITLNLGLVLPGDSAELVIAIEILNGAGMSNDIRTGYVGQTIPAYNLFIPINAASAASLNLCTFTAGTWQNGVFAPMTFSWSINYTQMQNILNYMAVHNWGANPAFPSLNPTQLTMLQSHVNAEMPNISTISLGWSMNNWTMQTIGASGSTKIYTTPIIVSMSETINAIATAPGFSQSAMGSALYVIQGSAATPTFSPNGGAVNVGTSVTIQSTTPGATIYYTTNGSTPNHSSPSFASGGTVVVSVAETIKAIASATGYNDSAIGSAVFTISVNPPAAAPTFSPVAGSYPSAQSVSVSSTTTGATIYYTIDGTTPVYP
jgi:hypothetical protein